MKRLVSTRHTRSEARANTRARLGDARAHARKPPAFKEVNMYIDRKYSRQQTSVSWTLELTRRHERGHLMDGVWMILNRSRRARAHVQTAKFGMAQTISYLSYRLILCIMALTVFAQCFTRTHAHTRTDDRQICFIFPLNVFPIDHCSKDVINNLKA